MNLIDAENEVEEVEGGWWEGKMCDGIQKVQSSSHKTNYWNIFYWIFKSC